MQPNLKAETSVIRNSNHFSHPSPSSTLNSQHSSPRSYNNDTSKTSSKQPKSEIDEALDILVCENNRDEVRQYLRNLM